MSSPEALAAAGHPHGLLGMWITGQHMRDVNRVVLNVQNAHVVPDSLRLQGSAAQAGGEGEPGEKCRYWRVLATKAEPQRPENTGCSN